VTLFFQKFFSIDFNVSKNGTLIKNDESCDGSVPWMSPEVLECNGVTTMIDVWSFGKKKK